MEPLKRVRFFDGKLVTAEDLAAEQNYFLSKQRLRNLQQTGPGVVAGLKVSTEAAGLRVAPGLAVDRLGRDIIVPESELVPYQPSLLRALLVLTYKETPSDPIPAPTWGEVVYTRIEEGHQLKLVSPGSPTEDGVILAELAQTSQGWQLKPQPQRGWLLPAFVWLFAALLAARR